MEIRGLSSSSYSAGLYPAAKEAGRPLPERSATEEIKERNAQAARAEPQENKAARQADSGPRIQFKDSEGTRVMEVYDQKNILIYQVPPKGMLMLIRSEDARQAIETSA